MVLLRNSKELQLGTCGLKVNNAQVQRNKGEKCSFMDLGGALLMKSSLEETGTSKFSDFSLAELWRSPIG